MTFVMEYISNGSASPSTALAYDQTIYADTVNYYGKPTPVSAVLKDKEHYLKRWPSRSNRLVENSVAIRCEKTSSIYIFEGDMNWSSSNSSLAQNPSRSGVASIQLGIKVSPFSGKMTVVQESSAVVSRSQ